MFNPKVVFFDAVGTLFRVRDSVGHVYGQIAADYGVEVKAEIVDRYFYEAFKAAPPAAFPNAGEQLPELERDWWRALVQQTFTNMGVLDAFRDFPRYFQEVFDIFETDEAWELYPETLPVLESLLDRQKTLSMISNFDSRLYKVLSALGLEGIFHSITISTAVGAAKPSSDVFLAAIRTENISPAEALHVGDHQRQDYIGAKQAGLQALWLNRVQPMMLLEEERAPKADTIEDLSGILQHLSPTSTTMPLVSVG